MQFLSDVYIRCPDCDGRRFRAEVLEVKLGGKSIADVLEMTVAEALDFFADQGDGLRGARNRLSQPFTCISSAMRMNRPSSPAGNPFCRNQSR